ncbi:MAG: iron permease [Proteobacteria bacterium]|nr:iron permease [Pseudomonadota bacterium]
MLSAAIVVFREALEIAMILGIVLAATRGLPRRGAWVAAGLFAGLCGAGLVALCAESISNAAQGMGQELFNAGILFTAALVIGWTAVWMQTHARQMSMQLKHMGKQVLEGNLPHYTLAVVVGLAMLREASEIVLFVYGMLASGQAAATVLAGTSLGLMLGSALGLLLYFGLMKMPARYALKVTSWMLILLVAGLSAQGAMFLSAAGYYPDFSQPVWDSSWLLSEQSMTGRVLHALIGYSSQPTQVYLVFYAVTLSGLVMLIRRANRRLAMAH